MVFANLAFTCGGALRWGLALGSGPDEKVARDFTSVPDPSARRICVRARPQCEAMGRRVAAEGDAGVERSAERSVEGSVEGSAEGDGGTGLGYFFSLKEFSMLEISSRKALSTLRRCSIVLQEWITVEWSRPPISWPMREAGILVCF